ncbi:MAG: hypothetical protein HY361_00335 [Candidatus Aenigmarchaeota archaeon]|nr:hypothetical protein [Candidatus Aenigmarchaeota archaeon]
MKKGISTVIATLLMLVITIALAGFAYTYLSGVVSSRTGVVLDILDATCAGDDIDITVRNEGTSPSGTVTVSATDSAGVAAGSCSITSIAPGTSGACPDDADTDTTVGLDRPNAATIGTYRLRASATGASPVTGSAFCSTAGVAA